jgi:hypothetical protein
MRTALYVIVAASLAGCGDPLFFAAVEDQRVCVQITGGQVEGVPPDAAAVIGEVSTPPWEREFDLGSQIPGIDSNGTTGDIEIISLTITTPAPGALGNIRRAVVKLSDADGNLEPYVDYEQPLPGDPNQTTLVLTAVPNLNLLERVRNGGKIKFVTQFTGSPPATPWRADIEACVKTNVMIDILKAVKD